MNEVGTQKGFVAHQSQDAAPVIVEPVDGPSRHILRHTLDLVIERPTIPAVEIALVLDKEIGVNRMKLARHHAGTNVWKQPPAGGSVDVAKTPFSFLGRSLRTRLHYTLRILGEHRTRER
jgi:hypothetical protein